MLIGYARTSTADQVAGLADQDAKLRAAGCERVYTEHASAATGRARAQLDSLLGFVREGDTLVVTRLDRLARSTVDILTIVQRLTNSSVSLRVLDLGGSDLDTRSAVGGIIIAVLGAVAQLERDIMLERQRAGITAAQAAGKYRGRAPTAQRKAAEVRQLRATGLDAAAIARRLGISRRSVWRVLSGPTPAQ